VTAYRFGQPGWKAARLREAVSAALLAHERIPDGLPTSNRFLYYQLRGDPALHGADSRASGRSKAQNLSAASKWLRDEGLVPWSWIVDERRRVIAYTYADSVRGYLLDSLADTRLSPWVETLPPLILCESATFGGVLGRTVAQEFLCPVAATSGQAGGFLHLNLGPTPAGE
jgi:hypothetical protein